MKRKAQAGVRIIDLTDKKLLDKALNAPEIANQKKFFTNYIHSSKYKERLKKQGYNNPDKTIKERADTLNNLRYVDAPGAGSQYIGDVNTIYYDANETKKYKFNPDQTRTHEVSHAVGASNTFAGRSYNSSKGLNDNDIKAIDSRNKLAGRAFDDNLEIAHDARANEFKADLDTLRYQLKKDKIYDAGTQDFDINHLKKAKEKYKTPTLKRLFKNVKSDNDLIYLMNTIAANDMKKTTFNPDSEYDLLPLSAKSGIKIKPSHKGLLHKNLGVPQGEKIPASKLAIKAGDSAAVKKRKQFAINAKKWNKGQSGINIPGAEYVYESGEVPSSLEYTPQLSPIEDLKRKGLLEPYQQNKNNPTDVGKFKIPEEKQQSDFGLGDVILGGLLATNAFLPEDETRRPYVRPANSYNPNQYGTGSQAIAQYGAKVSNSGYKSNSPDRGYDSLTIPSNQITMEGVPHDVYGVDDMGYSQIMKPGKNYQFPGNTVTEIPMRAQNGAVFQTQQQLDAANEQARRLVARKNGDRPDLAYVAKNIGDQVPQYKDPTGRPYNPLPPSNMSTYIPPYVKDLQWNPELNLPYYIDEKTGDIQYTAQENFNLPRFRKAPQQQQNDLAMRRMKNGGKAQNGNTFQTQQQLDAANAVAKNLATRMSAVSPENTYVGRNIGDAVPQYKDAQGNILSANYSPIPSSQIRNYIPPEVKELQWSTESNLPYYLDPQTGDIQFTTKENFHLPRFRKNKVEQKGDMIARMQNGGLLPGLSGKFGVKMSNIMNGATVKKSAKNGTKIKYLEGEIYNLDDDEIQELLDQGYELEYQN
jgi:hypothetical protein